VPAFVFWGSSFLRRRQKNGQNIVGKIANHNITYSQFLEYRTMAQISLQLLLGEDFYRKLSFKDRNKEIERRAWEYALLLWKAKKEKIKVSDKEVAEEIKKRFFPKGKFDKRLYFIFVRRILRIEPYIFERYLRKIIKAEKVLNKYLKVEVSDQEVKETYKKYNEKAKIAYIPIPYKKFDAEIKLKEEEIKNFYEKNKELFKEGAKAKIKYILLKENDKKEIEKSFKNLTKIKNIEIIGKKFNLPIKTTGFIGINDTIEGIGEEKKINYVALSMKTGEIGPLLKLKNGYILFQKIEEKPASISPFSTAREKVEAILRRQKREAKAKEFARNILEEIKRKNIKNLKDIAEEYKLEVKETDFVKYYDPILKEIGPNEDLSKIVFHLKKGEIWSSPFISSQKIYIIQLTDFIPIEEEKFKKEKEKYKQRLFVQRTLLKRLKFFSQLEKEANLVIYTQL